MARYGNGAVKSTDGDWRPLNQAKFTASNSSFEAKETIDAGFDGAWFYLVTGGETKMKAKLREMIRGKDRNIRRGCRNRNVESRTVEAEEFTAENAEGAEKD
jgi:hypothetical protein